jgi:toxin ParE1/3/4
MKPAIQRALAQDDIGHAFDHYLSVASATVASQFVLETDACVQRIERFPSSGSLRYAELLDIESLRFLVVERFPYLLFYFEREDHGDIVRMLHQHQDVPTIFTDDNA